MALIKCSECRKQISDKAKTCTNCGNQILQLKEISDKEIKRLNLTKSDINWYNSLGGEIELENIKKFSKTYYWYTVFGVLFLSFILLIPYFNYKQLDKPKAARAFLMGFLLLIFLKPICFCILNMMLG